MTTPAPDFEFGLACEYHADVQENSQGVVKSDIPQMRCAGIEYQGNEAVLANAIDYLFSQWLPNSGYQVADFPLFLERITFFPEVPESQAQSTLYLPIQ